MDSALKDITNLGIISYKIVTLDGEIISPGGALNWWEYL